MLFSALLTLQAAQREMISRRVSGTLVSPAQPTPIWSVRLALFIYCISTKKKNQPLVTTQSSQKPDIYGDPSAEHESVAPTNKLAQSDRFKIIYK